MRFVVWFGVIGALTAWGQVLGLISHFPFDSAIFLMSGSALAAPFVSVPQKQKAPANNW